MGCFNTKGFISGLTIKSNDPVVCIICTYKKEFKLHNYYTVDQIKPYMLPVFGYYDDYGSIRDIESNASSRILQKVTGLNDDELLDFFRLVSSTRESDSDILDTLKHAYLEEDDSTDKIRLFLNKGVQRNPSLTMVMEHKEIYNNLIKSPEFDEAFNDLCNFNSKIYNKIGILPQIFMSPMIFEFFNDAELVQEFKNLGNKYSDYNIFNLDWYFFNWHGGLEFYNRNLGYDFWGEPGFSKELSELQTLDTSLLNLGVGYNGLSGCGSQSDYNPEIVDFYKKCISFYENNLSV